MNTNESATIGRRKRSLYFTGLLIENRRRRDQLTPFDWYRVLGWSKRRVLEILHSPKTQIKSGSIQELTGGVGTAQVTFTLKQNRVVGLTTVETFSSRKLARAGFELNIKVSIASGCRIRSRSVNFAVLTKGHILTNLDLVYYPNHYMVRRQISHAVSETDERSTQ